MASVAKDDWYKAIDVVYDAVENKDGGFLTTLANTLGVTGLYQVSILFKDARIIPGNALRPDN